MQTPSADECQPCESMTQRLNTTAILTLLDHLSAGWQISPDQKRLFKCFYFKNYYQAIAFINEIAWMTHSKDHPPEMEINHEYCVVSYTTSAVDGLSEYDFLCATKVNSLFEQYTEKMK